jgi:phosphate transport system substrate-binding protein
MACPTYDDAKTADLVKGYLSYVVSTDGQSKAAQAAGSAPLPSSLEQKASTAIDAITGG